MSLEKPQNSVTLNDRRFWHFMLGTFAILLAVGFADSFIRQGFQGPFSIGLPGGGSGLGFVMTDDTPPRTIFGSIFHAAIYLFIAVYAAKMDAELRQFHGRVDDKQLD
jgi:hypothetical protein